MRDCPKEFDDLHDRYLVENLLVHMENHFEGIDYQLLHRKIVDLVKN